MIFSKKSESTSTNKQILSWPTNPKYRFHDHTKSVTKAHGTEDVDSKRSDEELKKEGEGK